MHCRVQGLEHTFDAVCFEPGEAEDQVIEAAFYGFGVALEGGFAPARGS